MMGWGGWGGRLNVLETFTWMGVRVRCEFRQLGVPTRRGEAALSIIIIILTTGRNHFQNWEQGKIKSNELTEENFFFLPFWDGISLPFNSTLLFPYQSSVEEELNNAMTG